MEYDKHVVKFAFFGNVSTYPAICCLKVSDSRHLNVAWITLSVIIRDEDQLLVEIADVHACDTSVGKISIFCNVSSGWFQGAMDTVATGRFLKHDDKGIRRAYLT